MKQPTIDDQTRVEDVPVSALLTRVRPDRYGTVPGLDKEELADPAELERQVIREEFGPVFQLPVPGNGPGIRPNVDEDGHVDWGAFGSVDFERLQPAIDKAKYKADKLREQVKDLVIRLDILNQRVQVPRKWRVIKYVRMGWMDVDDIEHGGLWELARLYMRIIRLKAEIEKLEEASRERRRQQARALWARYE
jgi:hypothetical protein